MTAALLLAAALAIVAAQALRTRRFPAMFRRLAARGSRRAAIAAWAGDLALVYAGGTVLGLALLGRGEALGALPPELLAAALHLGLPVLLPAEAVAILGGGMAAGAVLGIVLLLVQRARGKRPIGLAYRSPAAARAPGEWWAAALLALSAGISEELFFRLLLPLLVAIVTGSGVSGVALGWAAFVVLHRHQGRAGMAAVALIGVALSLLYLASGRLWLVMAVHVAIDLNALVVRPLILRAEPS